MIWKGYARRLASVLALKGNPIAVTYSMKPVKGDSKGRHWVCDALVAARAGATINLSKATSACPGGTWHLGLGPAPKGKAAEAVKKFLVEGEKLFSSRAAFHRCQTLTTPPPLGLATYVVMAPLGKAVLKPDVVVFFCNPEQACRLVTLATYHDGIPPRIELVGSTCHMAIAYPLVAGELNVSLYDYTSRKRKGYQPDEMIVSVPYHKMSLLVDGIDGCSAGTARIEYPPGLRKLMRETGR